MSRTTLRVRACAKINWSLEVTGRRDDGYHELVTVLQTIALDDLIDVTVAEQTAISVSGPEAIGVPASEENLVARALELYRTRISAGARSADRFEVVLNKRIPAAAGLGGGSTDAAAALRAINLLTDEPLESDHLESLAAELGSDTAFFIRGGTQLATGSGERLTPLPDAPTSWFVIVSPPFAAEAKTSRLYAMLTADHWSDGSRTRAIAETLRVGRLPIAETLVNTFERVADAAFPGLERYRAALHDRCGAALLCGAGPSLFAPLRSGSAAERAAAELRADGLRARAVQSVTAAESTAP